MRLQPVSESNSPAMKTSSHHFPNTNSSAFSVAVSVCTYTASSQRQNASFLVFTIPVVPVVICLTWRLTGSRKMCLYLRDAADCIHQSRALWSAICAEPLMSLMSSCNVAPQDVLGFFFCFFLEVQTSARHTPPLGEQENILLLFFPVCVLYTPSHEANNQCLLFAAPLAPASCSNNMGGFKV